jgi:hypothetical protein
MSAPAGSPSKKAKTGVPAYMKYKTRAVRHSANPADDETRPRPSAQLAELTDKGFDREGGLPPRIVELLNIEDNTTQVRSAVDIEQPLFQPFPAEVKYKDYAPFGVYEQTLFFRNNDHVARRIKVLPPQSPFFEVVGPRTAAQTELKQGKVAAGMEVCFVVKFRPQEVKEYRVDLVCCTEREKFVVPVRALGPRAVLALPDDVDFGVSPVKSTRSKSLIVQNVGTCIANFRLKCSPSVFVASPAEGIVEVGQTVMLELAFTPDRADAYNGEMVVEYVGQPGGGSGGERERDEVIWREREDTPRNLPG